MPDASLPDAPPPPDASPPDARPPPPDAPPPPPPDASPPDAAPNPCDFLPTGPVPTVQIPGIVPNEDFTFDDAGHIVWNQGSNIYRRTRTGMQELFVPGLSFWSNLRYSPTGDLWVADNGTNSLVRIDPAGIQTTELFGLSSPNGLEVDHEGAVYVTEFGGGSVIRFDPVTGAATVLNDGVLSNPNGITFNPYFDNLYYSTWGGPGTIWEQKIYPDGSAGAMDEFALAVGASFTHDGMAVDQCGNVYVAISGGIGNVVRINVFGTTETIVVSRPGETLHNFQWGRGYGGWESNRLYIISLGVGVFEADVGIQGKGYGPDWFAP